MSSGAVAGSLPILTVPHWCEGVRLSKARDSTIGKPAFFSTAFSQGLALRLADTGISVFEVRPGIIRSEMTAGVSSKYDALIAGGLVPMKRWGEPDDIGAAVAALASGRFAFATGSVLDLDGGLSIGRL